jgi:hypothetical protein
MIVLQLVTFEEAPASAIPLEILHMFRMSRVLLS